MAEEKEIFDKIGMASDFFERDYDLPADLARVAKEELANIKIGLDRLVSGLDLDSMKIAAEQVQDSCNRVRESAKPYAYLKNDSGESQRVEKLELPVARPIIVPKRYGGGTTKGDFGYTGLGVVNDGEQPGYDLTIHNIQLADGTNLVFHRAHTERLTKNDGEAFYPAFLEAKLGGTFGSGLFDFMREQGIPSIAVPITYRDSYNNWFQTDVTFERDVQKSGGLRLGWTQKRISDPTSAAQLPYPVSSMNWVGVLEGSSVPIWIALQHIAKAIGETEIGNALPRSRVTLRQAAIDGKVRILGRRQIGSRQSPTFQFDTCVTDAPRDYWKTHQITGIASAQPLNPIYPFTISTESESPSWATAYADLRVDQAEIDALWPPTADSPEVSSVPLPSKTATGEESILFDVFVSHATEDKPYVEPLVNSLETAGVRVWFDKTTLEWGDDLKPSIDRGLSNCRYGVVVFSKAFLRRRKWTEYELNSLFALEQPGRKIILPIWHGITRDDLLQYGAAFADRLAKISSKDSYEDIVESLLGLLGRSKPQQSDVAKRTVSVSIELAQAKPNAVAYAWYETTGENSAKAKAFIRPSTKQDGWFTFENSLGEEAHGTKEEIAMRFSGFDRSLKLKRYILMQHTSSDPAFNLS
jgi:TIR domain